MDRRPKDIRELVEHVLEASRADGASNGGPPYRMLAKGFQLSPFDAVAVSDAILRTWSRYPHRYNPETGILEIGQPGMPEDLRTSYSRFLVDVNGKPSVPIRPPDGKAWTVVLQVYPDGHAAGMRWSIGEDGKVGRWACLYRSAFLKGLRGKSVETLVPAIRPVLASLRNRAETRWLENHGKTVFVGHGVTEWRSRGRLALPPQCTKVRRLDGELEHTFGEHVFLGKWHGLPISEYQLQDDDNLVPQCTYIP